MGELVKNTEANKKPPYYSTDKIKSDQKTTKPGTTSRSKKKKSKIINEDLMVTFDVESIIEDKPSANRLKKLANRPFFTNRYLGTYFLNIYLLNCPIHMFFKKGKKWMNVSEKLFWNFI